MSLVRIILGTVGFALIYSQTPNTVEGYLIAGAGGMILALTYGLTSNNNNGGR
jgi:hypothetical protein